MPRTYSELNRADKKIAGLVRKEEERHQTTLNLIASENYPSRAVKEALGSIFVVKYSEGRPGNRYYAGMENIDELEKLAEKRVLNLFFSGKNQKGWAVNVQPYSGSSANYAVLRGLLEPGEKIMNLALAHGGHLSHGSPVSLAGKDFKIAHYFLDKKTELLDYAEIESLAKKEKPKLIICGYSAYPRKIDFKKFRKIADGVGAYLLADIAHIAGLIAGKSLPSPFPFADVVTTTTHKTLRGPRGAIIICKEELKKKIFSKVFPGLQGGPHNHTIAAIAVALKETGTAVFKRYAFQVVKNSRVLAEELKKYDFRLVSGGTDNHLILIDLTNKGMSGLWAQNILEKAGIIVNKNMIPYDERPPQDPSGIRLGTPAVTTRGMKEKEMILIAGWINKIINNPRKAKEIREKVRAFCKNFFLP